MSRTSTSFRGTYTPRSGYRGRYAPRGRARALEPAPDNTVFLRGLKESPLETIPIPSIKLSTKGGSDPVISEAKHLGSYSWTKRPTPTILVPASPAEWLDKGPLRVTPDTGTNTIDHNRHHMGYMHMLPLFAAVDANEEADTFDWSSVDVVTDRNALRHLLRWASGSATKGFRVDLQLAGKKTVLLVRWEQQATAEFLGYTYGTNYLNGTTRQAHPEAVVHHRVINYDWNGLNMVVRSTVDAFVNTQTTKSETSVDDIVDAISSLSVSRGKTESATKVKGTSLEVIRTGTNVPQESIVEVATISKVRESLLNWNEKGPQLYLSQISHFYVGLHDRGYFTKVRKDKFDYSTLPADVKEGLKKLRHALTAIQDVVLKNGQRRRLSLVCIDGVLNVYERIDDKDYLPDEFLESFGV